MTMKKTTSRRTSPPPTTTARKKRPSTAPRRSTRAVTEEQIRERAYYLYLQRNGHPGDALTDWLRAEQELTGGTSES